MISGTVPSTRTTAPRAPPSTVRARPLLPGRHAQADWHSLEVGLRQVAEDTGGQLLKVHEYAASAPSRMAAALAGRYVLTFERPEARAASTTCALSLARRRGTVLTRTRYVD